MRTAVRLKGLQLYAYHGLIAEERSLGQRFIFDVSCQLSEVCSHDDDQLQHSVGYDTLAEGISNISASEKFNTLEALAEAIARLLLFRHAAIESIDVSVTKHSPPMPFISEAASVEVSLGRAEMSRAS
ncbi:hypothetical protein AZSI13_30400 [Azospira sp. I13]|uniref:dihydroneopterin aldolase n=1 Tax=Azospira sp. I13 TaxID=1765050 RepID=UPI000D4030AA|nr:dihydroneopterin aldolase [Azospira sp. I13]GBG03713.1 hypothetical protein AZSI13_30400 [Azospira sp. I13]